MNKPIIPWDAVKFFSNPGKYELVPNRPTHFGKDTAPVLRNDGSLKFPDNWQGMREVTVIVERVRYVRMYMDGNRDTFHGTTSFATPEEANHSSTSNFIGVGTLTWKEEQ